MKTDVCNVCNATSATISRATLGHGSSRCRGTWSVAVRLSGQQCLPMMTVVVVIMVVVRMVMMVVVAVVVVMKMVVPVRVIPRPLPLGHPAQQVSQLHSALTAHVQVMQQGVQSRPGCSTTCRPLVRSGLSITCVFVLGTWL